MCFFFFFKQKTAYEMRISDWSSDVCSSDLIGLGHIDLAADLEDVGGVALQLLRDVGDVADVRGDVLTDPAVAARRRLHQLALFVTQRTGEAVALVLVGHRDRRVGAELEEAPQARGQLLDILGDECAVEAQDRTSTRLNSRQYCDSRLTASP